MGVNMNGGTSIQQRTLIFTKEEYMERMDYQGYYLAIKSLLPLFS